MISMNDIINRLVIGLKITYYVHCFWNMSLTRGPSALILIADGTEEMELYVISLFLQLLLNI